MEVVAISEICRWRCKIDDNVNGGLQMQGRVGDDSGGIEEEAVGQAARRRVPTDLEETTLQNQDRQCNTNGAREETL